MNEEKYNPSASDETEVTIVNALRERQRKDLLISQWKTADQKAKPKPRRIAMRSYIGMAAAACIALLLVFAPWKNGTTPTPLDDWMRNEMEASRAAFPGYEELAKALHAEDYLQALDVVNQSIAQSEAELEDMGSGYESDDEERAYELTVINRNLEESKWVRICLLIQMGRIKEAKDCLKDYCNHTDYVVHSIEASQLLYEIKKGILK